MKLPVLSDVSVAATTQCLLHVCTVLGSSTSMVSGLCSVVLYFVCLFESGSIVTHVTWDETLFPVDPDGLFQCCSSQPAFVISW